MSRLPVNAAAIAEYMAARITELVIQRKLALGWLHAAPRSRQVAEAIHALEDEPAAGEMGGPVRTPNEAAAISRLGKRERR